MTFRAQAATVMLISHYKILTYEEKRSLHWFSYQENKYKFFLTNIFISLVGSRRKA
jgi:hypothetical protein